jgi:hypothetical protein
MEALAEKVRNSRVQRNALRVSDYSLRQEQDLYEVANGSEPAITDDFEGTIFMRGSCGDKPCKGYYQ